LKQYVRRFGVADCRRIQERLSRAGINEIDGGQGLPTRIAAIGRLASDSRDSSDVP
jgi:hypothetical protein